jgi:hypothetical protein
MQRRDFLLGLGSIAGASAFGTQASAISWAEPQAVRPGYRAAIFSPGYHPKLAFYNGRQSIRVPELRRNLPKGYEGNLVLLSRFSERGEDTIRTLMPVKGHDVEFHPSGKMGIFCSQNGDTLLTFDPQTLDLGVFHHYQDGFFGGGHSVFLAGGDSVAVTERKPYVKFSGEIKNHEGRVAIRDSTTLKALEHYPCHGIAPHDVQVMKDGKHLAVANYGSTYDPKFKSDRPLLLDPSVTIIEIDSGKLVEHIRPSKQMGEIRHLAAFDRTRIFCLQNTFVPIQEEARLWHNHGGFHLPNTVRKYNMIQTSLPVLSTSGTDGEGFSNLVTPNPASMIRAQSVTYDIKHDQVIATFPGASRVLVFNGADGSLVKDIDTIAGGGLRWPRGLCLHPDGEHYIVAGDMEDIALFRRGSHERVAGRSMYTLLFGHSHITAL